MKKKKQNRNSVYIDLDNDVNKLIDETEDIETLLVLWKEEHIGQKLLVNRVDRIKNKIRAYLKERQWNRYDDKSSNISVSISVSRRETIDKKQLKTMLTDSQYAQIINIGTSEIMRIITPEMRENLKKFVK